MLQLVNTSNFQTARPTTRLSDLAGIDSILEQIRELVFYPTQYPELYSHLGVSPPCGILLHGPSGCGKSTLLSILGLLDTPSDGDYELNGQPVANLKMSERARTRNREIGFIFQSFNLIGDLSVYENVELPLTYRGMRPAERKERVTAALEKVEMAHRAKHLPSQLSGGQQQRVAVARAVCGQPSILLADEPTGNLDSKNGEAVMTLLHGDPRPALRGARRARDSPVRRQGRRRTAGRELAPSTVSPRHRM